MRWFILSLTCLISTGVMCQDTAIERKIMLAVIYLKSDKNITKEIERTYSYCLDSTQDYIDFKVNDELWFQSLYYFENKLKGNTRGLDSSLVVNKTLFDNKYSFTPYKLSFLSSIGSFSKGRILLTFSKPFGNYLLAEMLDTGYGASNKYKIGKSFNFLFVFNSQGGVEEVIRFMSYYR